MNHHITVQIVGPLPYNDSLSLIAEQIAAAVRKENAA